jgi:uncharacterized protein (TIGR02757 family)
MDEPLRDYLDALVARFERPVFIEDDPIAIPHGFDEPGDREVIGLYSALLAWGRRSVLLAKLAELCERMRYRPFRFVHDFQPERDASVLAGFKHRTFQPEDAFHLTRALSAVLHRYGSLQHVFAEGMHPDSGRTALPEPRDVGPAIQHFSEAMMTAVPGMPGRLQKHLARPSTGSACKRLSMYLRWMVRPGPVDFGQWTSIRPDQLVVPLDVHTGRQARLLGLLDRSTDDWRAAQELTRRCRAMCLADPARYDFALFGSGAYGVEHPVELLASSG